MSFSPPDLKCSTDELAMHIEKISSSFKKIFLFIFCTVFLVRPAVCNCILMMYHLTNPFLKFKITPEKTRPISHLFYEMRLIDTLSKHKQQQIEIPVDGESQNKREEEKESIQNQERSSKMGRTSNGSKKLQWPILSPCMNGLFAICNMLKRNLLLSISRKTTYIQSVV